MLTLVQPGGPQGEIQVFLASSASSGNEEKNKNKPKTKKPTHTFLPLGGFFFYAQLQTERLKHIF